MKAFTISRAASVPDALAAAAAGGRYIAGGTTLVDLMREEVEQPTRLVDIAGLPMRRIAEGDGGALSLGALVTMSEAASDPRVAAHQPLVVDALLAGASPQLRNMATLGGNLLQRTRCSYFRTRDAACNKRTPGAGCAARDGLNRNHAILGVSEHCIAAHPSDLAVALVALDARLRLRGPAGMRGLAVESLHRLPGDTPHLEHALEPGELITEIVVPANPYGRRVAYVKVRDRASYEFAVVSVAAALDLDAGGRIRSARLAAGGVATKPWRLRGVEAALAGRTPGLAVFEQAAAIAAEGARPQDQNAFKAALLPRTVVRALEIAGGWHD